MLLRHISLISALVVLGLTSPLLTQPSFAQPCNSSRSDYGRANWRVRGDVIHQLNLNVEQEEQITAIQDKYDNDIIAIQGQLDSAYQELRQMMSGTESEDVIRGKHEEITAIRQQMADLRFNTMLEIREVLTPEQREQLSYLMQYRRAHSRGMSSGYHMFP